MEKLQIGAATMQNSIEVPQKKTESRATLPEIPLQGMYPKITKTLTWKDIGIPMYCIPLCVCVCVCVYIYIYNVYWNIYIAYTTTFLSTNPFTDTHTHTHNGIQYGI